jgi:hypothetical protein
LIAGNFVVRYLSRESIVIWFTNSLKAVVQLVQIGALLNVQNLKQILLINLKLLKKKLTSLVFWLEILQEVWSGEHIEAKRLWKEGDEILRITVASINTAKGK